MKKSKIIGTVFGAAQALYQCEYWSKALEVAKYLGEYDGELYWTRGGPGSFLPWPRNPGWLQVMTATTQIDKTMYFLTKTGLYMPLALCAVGITGYVGWRTGKRLLKEK